MSLSAPLPLFAWDGRESRAVISPYLLKISSAFPSLMISSILLRSLPVSLSVPPPFLSSDELAKIGFKNLSNSCLRGAFPVVTLAPDSMSLAVAFNSWL